MNLMNVGDAPPTRDKDGTKTRLPPWSKWQSIKNTLAILSEMLQQPRHLDPDALINTFDNIFVTLKIDGSNFSIAWTDTTCAFFGRNGQFVCTLAKDCDNAKYAPVKYGDTQLGLLREHIENYTACFVATLRSNGVDVQSIVIYGEVYCAPSNIYAWFMPFGYAVNGGEIIRLDAATHDLFMRVALECNPALEAYPRTIELRTMGQPLMEFMIANDKHIVVPPPIITIDGQQPTNLRTFVEICHAAPIFSAIEKTWFEGYVISARILLRTYFFKLKTVGHAEHHVTPEFLAIARNNEINSDDRVTIALLIDMTKKKQQDLDGNIAVAYIHISEQLGGDMEELLLGAKTDKPFAHNLIEMLHEEVLQQYEGGSAPWTHETFSISAKKFVMNLLKAVGKQQKSKMYPKRMEHNDDA